jgi:hypothetical protein
MSSGMQAIKEAAQGSCSSTKEDEKHTLRDVIVDVEARLYLA